MSASSKSQRVIIVGGGISGLSIGVRLSQAGLPVTLLEASELGVGASTRNQGWLYSGAWFAPEDLTLARQCYRSLQQTLFYCPECVEPNCPGMIYLMADETGRPDRWTLAWTKMGIPFDPMTAEEVLDAIPHWNSERNEHAWRLPDRAIRSDILLRRLTNAAESRGVEIRTGVSVPALMKTKDQVQGVITATGEELKAGLVILATGGDRGLWSEVSPESLGGQPSYQLVNLKTHLMAIRPSRCSQPFCVLDREGFNHIPHASTSVFGSNRWSVVRKSNDKDVEPDEIGRITQGIHELLPSWDFSQSEMIEWSGTTVQAMHLQQVEPGRATLPTVINHETEPGGLKNLLSVFPGRACLWPQLAEMVLDVVRSRDPFESPNVAKPPWQEMRA